MDWKDIPQFPRAHYEVDIEWRRLEGFVADQAAYGLDLDPDFQRAHVWTMAQRVAFLEYMLQGGEVGRNLTFVCQDWDPIPVPGYAILDGKQRLESVRMFLRGDVRIFPDAAKPEGYAFGDFTGWPRFICANFKWRVVVAPTRADVLRLYLQINAGGTPHSPEELDRVRGLLKAEEAPKPKRRKDRDLEPAHQSVVQPSARFADDDGLADDRRVADFAQALRRTEGAALYQRRDDANPLGEREHVRHAGLQSATAPLAIAIRYPADTDGSLARGSDSDRRGKDLP